MVHRNMEIFKPCDSCIDATWVACGIEYDQILSRRLSREFEPLRL
jgi:hypothetical protein